MKHEGFSDGKWYYYKGKKEWFAIDGMTGLSIAKSPTKKEIVEKANSEEILNKYSEYSKRKEYIEKVNEWYKEQVKRGIIVENFLKND